MVCARCDRPICTECMMSAAVGWQCPECTSAGAKQSRHVPAFTHTSRGRTGVVGSTNPTPLVLTIIGINVVVGLRRRLPIAPVVGLLVINLLIGFSGSIDWRAHLGGLAVGALLAFLYDYAGDLRDRTTAMVLTVGSSVVVFVVLGLLLTGVAPGHVNLS